MINVNVLIIEDVAEEGEALEKVLAANNYTVVGIARTHMEAVTLFSSLPIDIVIIDIFLDGRPDGLAFAETINAITDKSKPFVFLSHSKDRQIFERAKLTRPYSFLLKPFNELEILYALEMAVEKFYDQRHVFLSQDKNTVISEEYLFVKKNKALKKVLIDDIVYIEVEERYCNIITEKDKFVIMMSLTRILELLHPDKFSRTHRNYAINAGKIEEIIVNDNLILLKGNHTVTLSDTYKSFLDKFVILN